MTNDIFFTSVKYLKRNKNKTLSKKHYPNFHHTFRSFHIITIIEKKIIKKKDY